MTKERKIIEVVEEENNEILHPPTEFSGDATCVECLWEELELLCH